MFSHVPRDAQTDHIHGRLRGHAASAARPQQRRQCPWCRTLTDYSQVAQPDVQRPVQVAEARLQAGQKPAGRHQQPFDGRRQQHQRQRNADDRIQHAEQLAGLRQWRDVPVADGRNQRAGEEQRLAEAPVLVGTGGILTRRDTVALQVRHLSDELFEVIVWSGKGGGDR